MLVEVLSSLDKDQRDHIIATLSDEAQFFKTTKESKSKDVLAKIFSALNNEAVASRIQTPEDFRRYADKVMAMAKTHVMYDKDGKVIEGYYASAAVGRAEEVVQDIQAVASVSRGDFDRDLDTILQMMRENPNTQGSIAQKLSRLRGLIRSSEDIERVGQFVKRLSEHGFSAQSQLAEVFGNQFGVRGNYNSERGEYEYLPDKKFSAWQETITDSKKLDDALSVMESAFTHGANPEVFVKKLNGMNIEEKNQFLVLSKKFSTKGIPPQFVADNLPLLQNCDFSKDGLAIFTSFEAQKKWLEYCYCVKVWKSNPQNIENIAKFFNEALSSEIKTTSKVGNIKGLSIDELADIQENVDEELGSAKEIVKPNEKLRAYASKLLQSALAEFYEDKNFEAIAKIQESIGGSTEAISALDQAKATALTQNDLIKFIPSLGGAEAGEIFPLTFGKAKEMIFAKLATDQDLADYFVENLDKYYQQSWVAKNVAKAIQQYSVAQKFIYAVENDQTVWKSEAWVVDVFAKAKVVVEEHQKQFNQDDDEQDSYGYIHYEGFSESDPFANHPWRFGGRQIRIASAISEMMAGKTNVQGLKELGISSKEVSPLLAEANEKVNTTYQNFLEQIRSNTAIKDEDKQALLNPKSSSVKMTSLLDNVRSFVARYFVQSVEGDVTKLSEIGNLSGELDRILAEGFRRYIKIHEVDVPLYDKLYEEFDTLRETGRSPLEVYLGRDGIYAYIGRHAQDVARRRKLGLEGRKKLKEMGEVVEIHPQYTVYPRYFRDNINQETKRQFLE